MKTKISRLRFSGCHDSVVAWRKIVMSVVKGPVARVLKSVEWGIEHGEFEVELTTEQRDALQEFWYKEVPARFQDHGHPYKLKWNDCVSYVDCDPVVAKRDRKRSERIERDLNS